MGGSLGDQEAPPWKYDTFCLYLMKPCSYKAVLNERTQIFSLFESEKRDRIYSLIKIALVEELPHLIQRTFLNVR